jgi:hypothetical protein
MSIADEDMRSTIFKIVFRNGIYCTCGLRNNIGEINCVRCGSSLTFLSRTIGILLLLNGIAGIVAGILIKNSVYIVAGTIATLFGAWGVILMTVYRSWALSRKSKGNEPK